MSNSLKAPQSNQIQSSSSSSSSSSSAIQYENCTYYNTTSQKFIFPPCFLKKKSNSGDNTFFGETNLNMIVFELLIKLVDFMHDNVKDIDRICESDKIIFNMFARKKKLQKQKLFKVRKK